MKAIALAALVLALVGCGSEDANETTPPPPVTVTETVTDTTIVTLDESQSSNCAYLGLTLPEQDLPPAVADVRKRVFEAAVECQFDTLEQIALEKGEGFTFSYGGGTSAAEYWRKLEESGMERPMYILATILTLPYTRNESGSYAWPTAYNEAPTDEAWQALVDTGLYTQEQIDSMKAAGSYLGYRTAITADGDWQFFVAGD